VVEDGDDTGLDCTVTGETDSVKERALQDDSKVSRVQELDEHTRNEATRSSQGNLTAPCCLEEKILLFLCNISGILLT